MSGKKITDEDIEKLAEIIIDSMTLDDLRQFVYDDLCHAMLDSEVYQINLEMYGE